MPGTRGQSGIRRACLGALLGCALTAAAVGGGIEGVELNIGVSDAWGWFESDLPQALRLTIVHPEDQGTTIQRRAVDPDGDMELWSFEFALNTKPSLLRFGYRPVTWYESGDDQPELYDTEPDRKSVV